MWRELRRTPDTGASGKRNKSAKHRQSARDCDCYLECQNKNVEQRYILRFLTKSLPPQEERITRGKERISKQRDKWFKQTEESAKACVAKEEPFTKGSRRTLNRDRIVPVREYSRKCVLAPQVTSEKETPCVKEGAKTYTTGKGNRRGKFSFMKLVATVKRKTNEFLFRRKGEKYEKDLDKEENVTLTASKPKVKIEPAYTFDVKEEIHVDGRERYDENRGCAKEFAEDVEEVLSVCSSVYFTPTGGESPEVFRGSSSEERLDINDESVISKPAPVESISQMLDDQGPKDLEEMRRRVQDGQPMYPNCDASIWMRSCEKEVLEPITGSVTGKYSQMGEQMNNSRLVASCFKYN